MFSYSFHLSCKRHAVSTIAKAGQVSRHNLRQYQSNHYDRGEIEVICGSEKSILEDIQKIYHQEFDEPLKEYNEHVRKDRQINDYLKHVSDSRGDIAAEIIIQVGDREFWKNKSKEERHQMSHIFRDQLRALQQLCPAFKIASAVIHYDEKDGSPHCHVLGIPVVDGGKKGLRRKVAKTKVFTRESLRMLQDKMREYAERGMALPQNQNLFKEEILKPKEKGRNKDIPKHVLDEFYRTVQETEQKREAAFDLDATLREKNRNVRRITNQIQALDEDIEARKTNLKKLDKRISEHEDLAEVISIYNKAYDDEIEIRLRERQRQEDWEI